MDVSVEHIPDEDTLYFFIHHSAVTYSREGAPMPKESAMHNTPQQGNNKSCDWSKYADPESTRGLLGRQYRTGKEEFKNPEEFFIFEHLVSEWRTVHKEGPESGVQEVRHAPISETPEKTGAPNNRAHSIIIGDKTEKVRTIMARKARWAIHPPATKAEMKALRKSF